MGTALLVSCAMHVMHFAGSNCFATFPSRPRPALPAPPVQGRFEECIADCDAAVDKGREHRADFKLVARALTRKANALVKLNRWEGSAVPA